MGDAESSLLFMRPRASAKRTDALEAAVLDAGSTEWSRCPDFGT
jgi:hypothetical protein